MDKKQEVKKLEVAIEKNLHQFIMACFEQAVDFTVLSIKKQKLPINTRDTAQVLDLARAGIQNGFLTGIDRLITGLNISIAEVLEGLVAEETVSKPKK